MYKNLLLIPLVILNLIVIMLVGVIIFKENVIPIYVYSNE